MHGTRGWEQLRAETCSLRQFLAESDSEGCSGGVHTPSVMPWKRAGHSFQGVLVFSPVQMLYYPGVEIWYDNKTPIIELDEDL